MLNIALCDDNFQDMKIISGYLNDYIKLHPDLDISLDKYLSSCDLLYTLQTKRYDIFLLDILMPSSNGIEVGKLIREKDSSCSILYLTSSPDYAVDSYGVKAQAYLLKPLDKDRFFTSLTETIDRWSLETRHHFMIRTKNGLEMYLFGDIMSVEYYKHRLYCRLKTEKLIESLTLRNSFDELSAPLLEDGRFLKISASVVINMNYVRIVGSKSMTLLDGTEFSVTRAYKDARRIYMDYMLKKGRIL